MTTEAAAKKDTQKLQRAIVDGLEDVKGQDIHVALILLRKKPAISLSSLRGPRYQTQVIGTVRLA